MRNTTVDTLRFIKDNTICAIERHDNRMTSTRANRGRNGFTNTLVKLLTVEGRWGVYAWTPEIAGFVKLDLFNNSIMVVNESGERFLQEFIALQT